MTMVAEGVRTTQSARELARKMGVEMPITETTYEVLFNDADARYAIAALMLRDAKSETA
jgi:glycerol-3-phosphate dehydrogenase (NAD(P)+)